MAHRRGGRGHENAGLKPSQIAAKNRSRSMASLAKNAAGPKKITMSDVRKAEDARMDRLLGPVSRAEAAWRRSKGGSAKRERVRTHTRNGARVSGYTRRG